MHSAYFKRLCESSFKDSSERKIYLQEDPPLAVRAMVAYRYDFEYESTFVESDFQPNGALNNDYEAYAQVFTIADKYDIPGLKEKVLEDFWLTFEYSDSSYGEDAERLLAATPFTYRHAPPNDRRFCRSLVDCWRFEGWGCLQGLEKRELEKLLHDVPEFAVDLVVAATDIILR